MSRLTKRCEGKTGYYVEDTAVTAVDGGFAGEAVERLAAYENMGEQLVREQERIAGELEQLRIGGKTKTVKFRELMGKKLTNSYVLSLLQANGLL